MVSWSKLASPTAAVGAMSERWALISALLGGTLHMRKAGSKWLPRLPKEEANDYEERLKRSILFNGLGDTVRVKLPGKPFSRPLSIEEEDRLPKELGPITINTDGAGNSLHEVGRKAFVEGISYGMALILSDLPAGLTGAESYGELQEKRAFPRIVVFSATQLVGFSTRTTEAGTVLETLRICETNATTDPDSFEEIERETILVFRRGATKDDRATWIRYTKADEDKEDQAIEIGRGSYPTQEIPITPWYAQPTGFLLAEPPLEALAWVNLEHWILSSDARMAISIAMIATFLAAGFKEEEVAAFIEGGLNWGRIFASREAGAKFEVVEHNGNAIQTAERRIEKLERQMEALGLQPFIDQRAEATATGVNANESGSLSSVQEWIQRLDAALTGAVWKCAELVGAAANMPPKFAVRIFRDFVVPATGSQDMPQLLAMKSQGVIGSKTLVLEAQRRGVISGDRDAEEIVAEAKTDMPPAPVDPSIAIGNRPPEDNPDEPNN